MLETYFIMLCLNVDAQISHELHNNIVEWWTPFFLCLGKIIPEVNSISLLNLGFQGCFGQAHSGFS